MRVIWIGLTPQIRRTSTAANRRVVSPLVSSATAWMTRLWAVAGLGTVESRVGGYGGHRSRRQYGWKSSMVRTNASAFSSDAHCGLNAYARSSTKRSMRDHFSL